MPTGALFYLIARNQKTYPHFNLENSVTYSKITVDLTAKI